MRELVVDGRRISDDGDCYVIAEIGHNHQGSLRRRSSSSTPPRSAASTRSSCRSATTGRCSRGRMYDQPYDNENSFGTTYGEHREALELVATRTGSSCMHQARELGITLFATAFDQPSADFLAELDVPAFKIASGDLVNTPLLRQVAAYRQADLPLDRRRRRSRTSSARSTRSCPINEQLCLLQCTAAYPAEAEELNLARDRRRCASAIPELVIGLSDHQNGIAMSLLGYMLGARVIEKHFTLSHALEGHRSCLLADAGRHAAARARPAPRAARARRRRQAAAAERGERAPRRWARSSSPRATSPPGTCSRPATSRSSRRPTVAYRPTSSTTARRPPACAPARDRGDRHVRRPRTRCAARGRRREVGVTRSALRSRRPRRRRHRRARAARLGLRRRARGARHEGRRSSTSRAETRRRRSLVGDDSSVRGRRHRSRVDREARAGRGSVGVPHLLVNNAGARLAAGRAGRGGRPVRDLPRGVVRPGHGRERQGHAALLPGGRRAHGRARAGDRSSTSRRSTGCSRRSRTLYEFRRARAARVRQAGRLLGLEVGDPQPDALPRDLLGEGRRAREHAHARGRRRRPAAGVPRRVHARACRSGAWPRRARRSARSSSSPPTPRRT